MKKIFLLLAMVLFSVNVFADDRSCTVYNSGGVVAYLEDSTEAVKGGEVWVQVNLDAPAPRSIHVVVNIYDLRSGQFIDNVMVYISKGERSAGGNFKVSGCSICTFKINSASCQ